MSLRKWFSVILMLGFILALSPLGAQAEPPFERPYYHHPHGKAYGWHGARPHGFDRHHDYFRRSCKGPYNPHYVNRVYAAPPPVAYVAPVAPVIGIPYAQPQPYLSQPAPRGLSGTLQYNF